MSNLEIIGYLDGIFNDCIIGWVFDRNNPNKRIVVNIYIDDKKVGEIEASMYRLDLEKNGIGDGRHGFNFKIPEEYLNGSKHTVKVFANCVELKNSPQEVVLLPRGYQFFEDQKGDSDSYGKLKRLGLPEDMRGLSVLDLGCNEGFFLFECVRRGATRCVGIDIDKNVIIKAAKRAEKYNIKNVCEFKVGSWWNIPNEKFDIILFLSSMHYEKNPRSLFHHIKNFLRPEGKLILECGVAPANGYNYVSIKRWDGWKKYPTMNLLVWCILRDYFVRFIGRSVFQSGDPIPRYIFHCMPKKTTYILVSGIPMAGKSPLVCLLNKPYEVIVVNSDSFFHFYISASNEISFTNDRVLKFLKKVNPQAIDRTIAFLEKADFLEEFVNIFVEFIPSEADVIIIEGFIFDSEKIKNLVAKKLKDRGGIVWELTRHLDENLINTYMDVYKVIGLESAFNKLNLFKTILKRQKL